MMRKIVEILLKKYELKRILYSKNMKKCEKRERRWKLIMKGKN